MEDYTYIQSAITDTGGTADRTVRGRACDYMGDVAAPVGATRMRPCGWGSVRVIETIEPMSPLCATEVRRERVLRAACKIPGLLHQVGTVCGGLESQIAPFGRWDLAPTLDLFLYKSRGARFPPRCVQKQIQSNKIYKYIADIQIVNANF